ncbi:MAG: DUF86 domain-containing protein [Deltaproteobacteria bacterium]|nr:DUF86 domain-containing protein [Deltaproteobacteria bacterium]
MLRNAVERNLEIIGEAANRIPESFRNSHPQIPWRNIIGQRNILIHEYGEIKNERIWVLATERIPERVILLKPTLSQSSTKGDQPEPGIKKSQGRRNKYNRPFFLLKC